MIDNDDMKMLKEVFITRKECDDISGGISKSEVEINISTERRIIKIETYQKIVRWILAGVGGGIITIILQMALGR